MRAWFEPVALGLVATFLWFQVTNAQESLVSVPADAHIYWEIFEQCRAAKHPADALDLFTFDFIREEIDQVLRATTPSVQQEGIERLSWVLSVCQDAGDVKEVRYRRTDSLALLEVKFIDRTGELAALLFEFVDHVDRGPLISSWTLNFSPGEIDLFRSCEYDPPPSFDTWLRCSFLGKALRELLGTDVDL
ncbi:MAG: hypothetical protein AAGH76_02345 [Pseudomonadota bacterium]